MAKGNANVLMGASMFKRLQAADPSIPAGGLLQNNAVLVADSAAAGKKVA